MNSLLTKEEKAKIAKSCKEKPYKMFSVLEELCIELHLMDISTFSNKSIKSKRTIYNMIEDMEFAKIEVLSICNQKFISADLNKHLMK